MMERMLVVLHLVGIQLAQGLITGTPTVTLPEYGTINGGFVQDGPLTFTRVNSFLGIPYAKAPVNNLRFQAPEQHPGWEPRTYVATSYKPPCVQLKDGIQRGAEDCLYLNVFVPGVMGSNPNTPLPVMIFIHGGHYTSGSAQDYRGDQIISDLDHQVILVTISYRLRVFGFLTSGDDVIPGNMGLKDQAFAIRWVHENIAHFGGDTGRVTLFGQGAGGACVKAHILSATNRNRFDRAIIQSGLSMWTLPDKAYHTDLFHEYGASLGCHGDNANILQCLQSADADDVIEAARTYAYTAKHSDVFSIPVIDGEFLHTTPREILQAGNYSSVDLIVGFNSDEGTIWFDNANATTIRNFVANGIPAGHAAMARGLGYCVHTTVSELGTFYDQSFTHAINIEGITNVNDLTEMVKNQYIPNDADALYNGRRILDAVRDSAYVAETLDMVEYLALGGARVYVYHFSHRTEALGGSTPMGLQLGAPHGGELPYVFGEALLGDFTDDERKISQAMIQAWTTFAEDGTPVYHDLGYNRFTWPTYTTADRKLVVFDAQTLSTLGGAVTQAETTWLPVMQFWRSVRNAVTYRTDGSDDLTDGRDNIADTTEDQGTDEIQSPEVTSEKTERPRGESREEKEPEVGEKRESSEMETEYLKLNELDADIAIIVLACVTFLLLLLSVGLTCKMCRSSKY